MTTVLVTGASGFVGSHLLPELVGAGHRVVALVRSQRAGERVMRGIPAADAANVELRTGDVDRPTTLSAALAGVDAVVHLAAIPRDWNGGRKLLAVNLGGTRNVIAAMEASGVRRLVHLGALGVEDREKLHYARSKARAERAVMESGLDWTISSRRCCSARATASSTSSPVLSGSPPESFPSPATGRAVSSPSTSPTWRCASGSAWSGPRRSGTPSSWAGPGPGRTARSRPRSAVRPATAGSSSACRSRSSRSSPARPRPSTCRSRSPRTSFASSPRQRRAARRRARGIRVRSAQNGRRAPVPAPSEGGSRARRRPHDRAPSCLIGRTVAPSIARHARLARRRSRRRARVGRHRGRP